MFKLVILCYAVTVASVRAFAPLGWGGAAGWANQGLAPLGVPLVAPGVAAAPALGAYNYRGPLSLAPGQPANILAADGRPLDTLSVNLDRAAHYTARAVDGARQKRSVLPVAPVVWARTAGLTLPLVPSPLFTPVAAGPLPVGAWNRGAV